MARKKKKKRSKGTLYATFIALGLTFAGEKISSKAEQGKDHWDEKVLADDEAHDINFKPEKTTLHKLVDIPTQRSKEGDPRQPVELKTYTIECNIAKFLYEDDGDIHLVLADSGRTMIGEIPFPYFDKADESGFKSKFIKARKDFHKATDKNKDYARKRFIITGVGFVDFPHNQTGHADNNLELHPILSITPKK